MYYARELFVKRGPLATLWLAGHVMRKVHKQQVMHANIEQMCDVVENPPVALALPTQSTLLRGVCRIEQRKATYLLEDAEGATSRLVEPKAKETTTLPASRIKARVETITFTDEEQAHLQEGVFPDLGQFDDVGLLVDTTGDLDMMFAQGEDRMREAELSALQARPEDITMTQDLSEIGRGIEFDEMQFGSIEQEIEMGDGFADVSLDLEAGLAAGAVSPAISELAGAAPSLLDLDAMTELPSKKRAVKRKRAFVPQLDEHPEMSDHALRIQLQSTADILTVRPRLPPSYRTVMPIDEALMRPAVAPPDTHPSVPEEVLRVYRRACEMAPVIDEAGHTAAEVEMELGGEGGWDYEAGFEAEEARAEEMESIVTGYEMEDLSRSIQRGEGVEGEAVLFGLTEPEAPAGVRGRRDVSGRFEIVSDMETPDIGVPESQFEVPKEEVRVKPPRLTIDRRAVSKHTEIIRNALEKKFAQLSRAKAEMTVELDGLLTELVHGDPVRRDRSLAFFQVLVLVSLDIIRVRQDVAFGDIAITKGPKWAVRLSSSQLFSDTPTQ